MKIKSLLLIALLAISTSCVRQQLAHNLSHPYAENQPVGIQNIDFKSLQELKRGEACVYKLFYLIPIGDDSIIDATRNGGIGSVQFIGKDGFWSFPLSKNCTVVYGS